MQGEGLRWDRFRLGFSAAVLRLQKTQPKNRRKKCPCVALPLAFWLFFLIMDICFFSFYEIIWNQCE